MSTGLSNWWATPSDPAQHFSEEELLASDRYHRPIRRAGILAAVAKVTLLLMAVWLVGQQLAGSAPGLGADSGGADQDWPVGAGFFDVLTSRSLLIGAGLTTAALRIPAIAVDAWFEYRFRHGSGPSDEFEPVPVQRFMSTVLLLGALVWCGFMVAGAAIYPLAAASQTWLLLVAVLAASVVWIAAAVEWPIRRRLPSRPQPLDALPVGFGRLLARFGLDGIPVLVGAPSSAPTPLARNHFNAASMGLGRNRRIVVSNGFLGSPASVQEFVVAHELSHLTRHHLLAQTFVAAVATAALIVAVGAAVAADRFWASLGVDLLDPLFLPAVVLLALVAGAFIGPVTTWVGRAQERTADADAIAAAGPLSVGLARQLYAQANTDLDPPRWARLIAQHPSPAERLEFAERHRRAG